MDDPSVGHHQDSTNAFIRKAITAEGKIAVLRAGISLTLPAIYWFLMDKEGTLVWLAVLITISVLIYSPYILLFRPYEKYSVMYSGWLTYALDTLFISAWVIATGGFYSPFYPIFIIAVVGVAFRFDFKVTLFTTFIYSFLYLGIAFFQEGHVGHLVEVTTRVLFILIAGTLAGFMTKEAMKQTEAVSTISRLYKDLESLNETISDKEYMLAQFLENLPVGLFILKEDGSLFYTNKMAMSLLGKKMEEPVENSRLTEFFNVYKSGTDQIYPYQDTPLYKALMGKNSQADDMEIRRKGKVVPVEVFGAPIVDKNRKVIFAVASFTDISDRRKVEETNARLASIVTFSNEAILSKTLDGIITSWNPGAERIFGYAAKEAIGKNALFLLPPGQLAEEAETINKIKSGKYIAHYETIRKRKDGEPINVSFCISPIKNEKGEITGVSEIARDITEKINTEREIIKINKFLNAILEHLPVMVFVKDAKDLKFVSINKKCEEIVGITREEMIGKNDYDFFPKEEADFFTMKDREVLESRKVLNIEEEKIMTRDQGKKWLHTIKVPVFAENGKPGYLLGISEDITEKRNITSHIEKLNTRLSDNLQKLKKANEDLKSFTYSVSHDLRSPLRAIRSYTQILAEDYSDAINEEGKRIVNVVKQNAEKMENLINDLLVFSRTGTKELRKNHVNMNQLISNVLKDFQLEIPPNGKIILGELLPLYGDYSLLTQVMINLISNAVKYSSKNPSPVIEIGSYIKENDVVYYIRDNGVGFDMKYANKLFGVFQRLHSDQEFEGTGVGLAIVEKIIHRHGGKVWANAEVNKGAGFYFSIPKMHEEGQN